MRVVCKKCGKFFFETNKTVIISGHQCPRCKEVQNIKIVTPSSSEDELFYKFDSDLSQGSESSHSNA